MTQPSEGVFDLLIVGGGMVGMSLIAALRHHCPSLSLALVEAAPEQAASPSFDGRATVLSFGSQQLFEHWGCWSALAPNCTDISQVQVSDRGHFGAARITAAEEDVPALGYVIENRHLGCALQNALSQDAQLHREQGVAVQKIRFLAEAAEVELANQTRLKARLLVLADGGRSPLAARLGVATTQFDYQQSALVAAVGVSQPHCGRAFERFTDEGPIALLPMVGEQMALIWTMSPSLAERRLALSPTAFLAQLQDRFGERLGRFTQVSNVDSYPLCLRQTAEQVRSRLVVLGNAAHELHPVAGQGFNLCMRDISALACQLEKGLDVGEPIGLLSRLQQYQESQHADQERTCLASDLLVRGFSHSSPLVAGLRSLSLLGLNHCPPLKHWLARAAMGLD